MIIFDYATLACNKHRRHFIEHKGYSKWNNTPTNTDYYTDGVHGPKVDWLPDYESYYAAAGEDRPIEAIVNLWANEISLGGSGTHQIWCDISYIYAADIHEWLDKNLLDFKPQQLRMRPDGDTTPWHELKEKWLNEMIEWPKLEAATQENMKNVYTRGNKPEMAFEPESSPMIETWKKYGVTCFEVHDGQ